MNKTICQVILDCKEQYLSYDFQKRIERRKGKNMDIPIATENILILKKIFDRYKIPFFLLYGTLLGAIREKSFIVHDTDTDIGMWECDKEKLIIAIHHLLNNGFKLIRTKNPDDLVTLMRKDEYIDIGLFKLERDLFGRKYYYYQNKVSHRILYKYIYKFDQINFYGEDFNIPIMYKKLLKVWYGKTWNISKKNSPAYNYEIIFPIKRIVKRIIKNIIRRKR